METDKQEDKRKGEKDSVREDRAEMGSPAMKALHDKNMRTGNSETAKPAQMKKTEAACKKAPYSRGC